MVIDETKFSTEELLHDLTADIRNILEASKNMPEIVNAAYLSKVLNEIHDRIDDIAQGLGYDDYNEDAE